MTHSNRPTPSVHQAQEAAILVLSRKRDGDETSVYNDLYNALAASGKLGKLLSEYGLTRQEMEDISRHLLDNGLCWEKHIFMPVQIFCRARPLRYVLEHKEDLTGKRGQEAFAETYRHLRNYFLLPLG